MKSRAVYDRVRRGRGSFALNGLFVLVALYALDAAQPVLLPMVSALMVSFVLAPVVSRLETWGIPRTGAAALVVALGVSVLVAAGFLLAGPAQQWFGELPERLQATEAKLSVLREPVEIVNAAAERVSEMTGESAGVQEVSVREGAPLTRLVRGTGAVIGLGVVSLALVFFFLADGRKFLLRLVRVLPGLGARKRALRVAVRLRGQASFYLLTVTVINAVLGTLVGLVLWGLDIPNPLLWGVMAALLNYVPYLGALVGIGVVALVAITTLDTPGDALIAPGAYLLLTSIEGTLVTPAILGRSMRLNPTAVLVSLLFWGWLWGILGALLAVPLLATLKVVMDAHPSSRPIADFLER